jgi:hypothetical protein
MKLEIDTVLNPLAAGPARASFLIVPGEGGKPNRVACIIMGEGKTIRMMLDAAEARGLGEMALVCGCVAEGGPPPMAQAPKAFELPLPRPVIFNGGKH